MDTIKKRALHIAAKTATQARRTATNTPIIRALSGASDKPPTKELPEIQDKSINSPPTEEIWRTLQKKLPKEQKTIQHSHNAVTPPSSMIKMDVEASQTTTPDTPKIQLSKEDIESMPYISATEAAIVPRGATLQTGNFVFCRGLLVNFENKNGDKTMICGHFSGERDNNGLNAFKEKVSEYLDSLPEDQKPQSFSQATLYSHMDHSSRSTAAESRIPEALDHIGQYDIKRNDTAVTEGVIPPSGGIAIDETGSVHIFEKRGENSHHVLDENFKFHRPPPTLEDTMSRWMMGIGAAITAYSGIIS